ncbi:MAG: VCBS repeat-containing protein, partial [Xanthomonadales bacterium]|nr:VCBS repeat-containing protein [Xanthomonadales bacterium]
MMAIAAVAAVPVAHAGSAQVYAVPSSDIPCQQTPFGRSLTLGLNQEMVDLLEFGSNRDASLFREWNLSGDSGPSVPPFASDISEGWRYYPHGAQGSLLRAVRADLDGDGRDEIIVAMDVTDNGPQHVTLNVFRRQPYTSSDIDHFSTWTLNVPFDSFDMVAGDFDGSRDGRQELAVMLHTSASNNQDVFVLTGDAAGGIAQAANVWAGFWTWHPASNQIGLAG